MIAGPGGQILFQNARGNLLARALRLGPVHEGVRLLIDGLKRGIGGKGMIGGQIIRGQHGDGVAQDHIPGMDRFRVFLDHGLKKGKPVQDGLRVCMRSAGFHQGAIAEMIHGQNQGVTGGVMLPQEIHGPVKVRRLIKEIHAFRGRHDTGVARAFQHLARKAIVDRPGIQGKKKNAHQLFLSIALRKASTACRMVSFSFPVTMAPIIRPRMPVCIRAGTSSGRIWRWVGTTTGRAVRRTSMR